MKLPIHCTSHVPGRKSALLSAIALICSACATQHTIKVTPPALQGTDVAVRITDVNVLAVSPAMETFLERYILPYPNLDTRLDLLAVAVAENGVLGFNYADSATSTAEETFSSRSGNCISHANMVIALARRAGLDAHYQQVAIQPQWTSREDTVLIRKHINVVLTSPKRTYHLDVSGIHVGPEARITILSDRDGKAMYFNNLGVAALIDNDLATAYAYMVEAINTAPQLADPWINLGVVFRRNKQLAEAELSHKSALQIDPREYSAMNNLYAIYRYQKRLDDAEELQRKVEHYRRKNPYYLLMLSKEALAESRFEESARLLKRAIKKKGDDHRLHFAMAKTQYLSGQSAAAQDSLLRARALAPASVDYSLPLELLIDSSDQ